jgi:hypothetical protein
MMTIKIFTFILLMFSLMFATYSSAESKVENQTFLRFTDKKDAYGKTCEAYSYISPSQRLTLLKQNSFMLGDILSGSLFISEVDPEYLVATDLTNCDTENIEINEYTYNEDLEYLNDNIVTIEVSQYTYGAGAAHGNSYTSHYIYDREYGMEIDWRALFGSSEDFDLYVLERVIEEIADDEFMTYFEAREQLLNFRKVGYFAITEKGLFIQYGQYEITPGASGLPSIEVPKEVLKQYMSEKMFQTCFEKKESTVLQARN